MYEIVSLRRIAKTQLFHAVSFRIVGIFRKGCHPKKMNDSSFSIHFNVVLNWYAGCETTNILRIVIPVIIHL